MSFSGQPFKKTSGHEETADTITSHKEECSDPELISLFAANPGMFARAAKSVQ
jgi:response regulator RpfG family c-di-GMP phosphodiesterase